MSKSIKEQVEEFNEATKTRIAGLLALVAVDQGELGITKFLEGNTALLNEALQAKDTQAVEMMRETIMEICNQIVSYDDRLIINRICEERGINLNSDKN